MAYLVFTVKDRELGRRTLAGPIVIGRSPECDVCVHDILLSRRHCQIEQDGLQWVLIDLASKNGTYLGSREIGRHALHDGETVRIGKTLVSFHSGVSNAARRGGAAMEKPNKPKIKRPSDPWEAMAATVSGMQYVEAKQKEQRIGGRRRTADLTPAATTSSLPTPQPSPLDPRAYASEDVYSLLTDLASSSWDSIYMNASRPAPSRPAPSPIIATSSRHPRHRGSAPADLSLQVVGGLLADRSPRAPRPSHWRRAFLGMARGFAAVAQTVMVVGIVHLLG